METLVGRSPAVGPTDTLTAEVVVHGRGVVVPDHFRTYVDDKLARLGRYDGKIHRVDVELAHEKNRRQNDSCQHVEITCRTRGPVVRAEACAEDFHKALDLAVDKLERRLRHAADRRRVHHGRRTPESVAHATAAAVALDPTATDGPGSGSDGGFVDGDALDGPGRIVRTKEHVADPMSVDQALFEMELVGHDFFLFRDVATDRASVVYRRHAYDYGLIRLG